MPDPDDELFDAVAVALSQASEITGRKYRYGATLLAGEDHIPMKSGSNKKVFQRDEIHAEMSVLKGCARPEGKDMLIARLAPVKPSKPAKLKRSIDDEDGLDDDDDDDDDEEDAAEPTAGGVSDGAKRRRAASAPAPAPDPAALLAAGGMRALGKVLNARPCARCEAKMVARGIRRCFFTLDGQSLGVLQYNRDPAS